MRGVIVTFLLTACAVASLGWAAWSARGREVRVAEYRIAVQKLEVAVREKKRLAWEIVKVEGELGHSRSVLQDLER
jgi:hypothetical protein